LMHDGGFSTTGVSDAIVAAMSNNTEVV